MRRRAEDDRRRHQHLGQRPWVVRGIGRALRDRHPTGHFDETPEVGVGHRVAVDPEAVDRHLVRGRLFGVVLVGAHQERAAWNPCHRMDADGNAMRLR